MRFIFTKHKMTTKDPRGKRKIKTFNAFSLHYCHCSPSPSPFPFPPHPLETEAVPPIEAAACCPLHRPESNIVCPGVGDTRPNKSTANSSCCCCFVLGFQGIPLVGPERVLCAWKFDKLLFDFIAVFAQNSILFAMANILGVFLYFIFISYLFFLLEFLFTFMCLLFDAGFGALPSEKLRHFPLFIDGQTNKGEEGRNLGYVFNFFIQLYLCYFCLVVQPFKEIVK